MNISTFGDLLHAAREQANAQRMIDSIQSGAVGRFIAFDRDGQPVQFC